MWGRCGSSLLQPRGLSDRSTDGLMAVPHMGTLAARAHVIAVARGVATPDRSAVSTTTRALRQQYAAGAALWVAQRGGAWPAPQLSPLGAWTLAPRGDTWRSAGTTP